MTPITMNVAGVVILAAMRWYFYLELKDWLTTIILAGIAMVVISLMQQIVWMVFARSAVIQSAIDSQKQDGEQ